MSKKKKNPEDAPKVEIIGLTEEIVAKLSRKGQKVDVRKITERETQVEAMYEFLKERKNEIVFPDDLKEQFNVNDATIRGNLNKFAEKGAETGVIKFSAFNPDKNKYMVAYSFVR